MLSALNRIDQRVVQVEKWLLGLITGLMVLILTYQVVARYIFSRPLFWAEEISVELLVFATLFGFSVLLQTRKMIEIDILVRVLPRRVQFVIALVLQGVGLAVLCLLAVKGTTWLARPEVRLELSPTTGLPLWFNYAVFPVAFYAMVLHQTVGLFNLVAGRGREASTW